MTFRRILINASLTALCMVPSVRAGQTADEKRLSGTINNRYGIRMVLSVQNNDVSGTYSYIKVGKPITLKGKTTPGGGITLQEFDAAGKTTGTFSGRVASTGSITGMWSKPDGSGSMPFSVQPETAAVRSVAHGSVHIDEKQAILTYGVKGRPEFKEAKVSYPVVSGLSDSAVLARVQQSISLKSVFETSLEDIRTEFKEAHWLEELSYEVEYNENDLLQITFTMSGVGAYPDSTIKHVLVSLKTGDPVTAATAFKADSLTTLTGRVRKMFQAEVQIAIKDSEKNGEDVKDMFANLKYERVNLDHFIINDNGVTFLYDYDFPHVIKAAEPDGTYFFSFAELKAFIDPYGPLGVLIR